MCGIAGKVYAERSRPVDEGMLRRMCDAIAHRGPDDEGYYTAAPVGLCMRRLQVIDLHGGHQPMSNEDGTVWLVFNGEIYNYRPLRERLQAQGHRFATASDTETILHLYEEKGRDCVEDLQGMFAFALWDERDQSLLLARDRLGKKPLFYAEADGGLAFSSELGSLLCDKSIERELDYRAIDEYLSYLFVPHPRTVFRQVRKLPPGSRALYKDGRLTIDRYWEVRYGEEEALPPEQAADRLDVLLRDSVKSRLLADVPVGAFLSGGLDSSLVVALMRAVSDQPVRTFAIGFEESSFNELAYAREVAQALGTEHREYTVRYEVESLIPKMLDHFGEPFADSSAIPTYHLSRVTREDVTVALSGDGGDEVFGGYRRYQARRWAEWFNRWPGWGGRAACEWGIERIPEPATYYGKSWRKKARRFVEFARMIREAPETSWGFFFPRGEKNSLYTEKFADIINNDRSDASLQSYFDARSHAGSQEMLWIDLMSYLPDDILVKVDRMSMACSLEVRVPLLDYRVVEFMSQIDKKQKFTQLKSKVLLRDVARRYLPREILERPKQGFAVPLAGWLQGPLRNWLEGVLFSQASKERGLFETEHLRRMVDDHVAKRRDYSQQLWALGLLEMWLQGGALE